MQEFMGDQIDGAGLGDDMLADPTDAIDLTDQADLGYDSWLEDMLVEAGLSGQDITGWANFEQHRAARSVQIARDVAEAKAERAAKSTKTDEYKKL